MRKLLQYGIVGLSAYVIWRIVAKVNAVGSLLFKISKVAFTLRGDGLYLTFFIEASNEKETPVLINSLVGDLYFNGEKSASFNNDLRVSIPEKGKSTILLTALVYYSAISEIILDTIKGTIRKTAVFELQGTANIEDVPIPFHIKYSMI